MQAVQIASADGNEAIIASGLQPGMQVVATGVHVLTDGQKVTVYRDKYAKPEKDLASNQPQTNTGKALIAPESEASQPAGSVEAAQ